MRTTEKRAFDIAIRWVVLGAIALSLTCALFASTGRGQNNQRTDPAKEKEIRKKIAAVIQRTIKDGEFEAYGVKAWSRKYPTTEEVDEIKQYGDEAVPVLAEYLKAKDSRERMLAIRLLGLVGGKAIVEPLRRVVQTDAPLMRSLALTWLAAAAPWRDAYPILREAAENDPEPRLRKEAKGLLDSYAPK